MTGISSLGVGSGLDLDGLVRALVGAERSPQENRLNRRASTAQTTLSALGSLRSALSGLTGAVNALKDLQVGQQVSSSDVSKLAATRSGEPEQGSYQVRVMQLASAQSLASAGFEDPELSLGAGTLTLGVGGATLELEITEPASTLRDVRDAINDSDMDVRAVIVRDGQQYRLLVTSAATGTLNEVTLATSGSLDSRLASAAMTQTAPAQDAEFSVNGLVLTSASNTIEDVLPGITLVLTNPTEALETVTVTVDADRQGASDRISALVTAYNTLVENMRASGRADPAGGNSGPLIGDASLRAIQSRIGGVFSRRIDSAIPDSPFETLLDLGLSTDRQGRAQLDAGKLDEALRSNPDAVEAMVSAFASTVATTLEGFSGPGGVLESRTTSLAAELKRITGQREALDRRMELVETRLRRQFTALDSLLSQSQNTSAYLAQQLAGIANLQRQANP